MNNQQPNESFEDYQDRLWWKVDRQRLRETAKERFRNGLIIGLVIGLTLGTMFSEPIRQLASEIRISDGECC